MYVAGFAPVSRVNGPGPRVVLWVQGCDLACPGCFNPTTHRPGEGEDVAPAAVVARILDERGVDTVGVTFSGGEPFQQAEALAQVAEGVRAAWPEASLMAFTGYRFEALRGASAPPGAARLLRALDWLVDGRYEARLRHQRPWRASTNQRLWVVGRPLPPDTLRRAPPDAELVVTEAGAVLLSGFPDAGLRRAIEKL